MSTIPPTTLAVPTRRPAAVLLDRDGTILTETGYLREDEPFELIPGAAEAVGRLRRAGIRVAVVTNQSAIARGMLTEPGLARIHAQLARRLAAADADAVVEHWLHCPHHPEVGEPEFRRVCACRKPLPGMLIEGARRLGVPLEACASVGDSWRDLAAAAAAAVPAVLVTTGKGAAEWRVALSALGTAPPTAPDLGAAVDWLMGLPTA